VGQKPIAVNVGGEIEDGGRRYRTDRVILSSASGNQTIKPTNDPEALRPPAHTINMDLAWPAGRFEPVRGGRTGQFRQSYRTSQFARDAKSDADPFQLAARTGRPGRR
jgi:hypothetical protein